MKQSAGILLYRYSGATPEVFLVHPGGPFWKNKDTHAWSIPKGEFRDEEPAQAARREFQEETGHQVQGRLIPLEPIRQSGKIVHAFACRGNLDPGSLRSNTFEMEWPPGSGKKETFKEVDRGGWFGLDTAMEKVHKGQQGLLNQLRSILSPE